MSTGFVKDELIRTELHINRPSPLATAVFTVSDERVIN